VTDADRPDDTRARDVEGADAEDAPRRGLLSDTPLAGGSVAAGLAGVVVGFLFVPQLLALALGGLSLARREPNGRGRALLGIGLGLLTTVVWGVVLGLLLKWWVTSR
jgi:hypothetical protein